MKSKMYFKHDIYATVNDRNLRAVCKAYPVWGEAVFFSVITMLYRVDGKTYETDDLIEDVADALFTDNVEKIGEIINVLVSKNLLKKRSTKVWSERVKNECDEWTAYSCTQAEKGRKGGLKRVQNMLLQENDLSSNGQATAKPLSSDCQANKIITKEKEIKKESNKEKKEETDAVSTRTFRRPTLDEIRQYCDERKNTVDVNLFFDFYESKGWKVGNQPMKDWRACVRTWERERSSRPSTRICNDGALLASQRNANGGFDL